MAHPQRESERGSRAGRRWRDVRDRAAERGYGPRSAQRPGRSGPGGPPAGRILLHAAGEQEENDLGASAGRPVYRALQAHCRPRSRAEREYRAWRWGIVGHSGAWTHSLIARASGPRRVVASFGFRRQRIGFSRALPVLLTVRVIAAEVFPHLAPVLPPPAVSAESPSRHAESSAPI